MTRAALNTATVSWTDADVDAIERAIRPGGQRPGADVYRFLGFLRAIYSAGHFASQHFPASNPTSTGAEDERTVLTGIGEMLAIAVQMYRLTEDGVPGGVVECGCYKGYSTSILSIACSLTGRTLDVFDSFQGLPSSSSQHYRPGQFAGSLDEVREHVASFGRPEVVRYHPGFFSDSVPKRQRAPIAVLWLDVDLEESARDALKLLPDLDRRGTLFTHECVPEFFDAAGHVSARGGPDDVLQPIVDAFRGDGRDIHGTFLTGNLGACRDRRTGLPVMPQHILLRLLSLALA